MKLAPQLNNEQLENYLLKLVEKILQEHKLQLSPQDKKTLVGYITQVMMEKGEFSREHVIDKNHEFMHKLTLSVVAGAKMNKIAKLLEDIKKIFEKRGITPEDLLNPKALEKKLLPNELKQLKLLQEKIKETMFKMDELKLIKLPRPKPGAAPEIKEEDINTIILGLTDPKIQGSHPKIVSYFVGNLYGIADLNPYNGNAPLDQDNKIATMLGVHPAAKERYESCLGAIVNQVIAETNRPTLIPTGGGKS
jgi:hypothetical protein